MKRSDKRRNVPLPPISNAVKKAIYKRAASLKNDERHPYDVVCEDVLHVTRKTFNKMMHLGRFDFTADLVPLVQWTGRQSLIEEMAIELTSALATRKEEG